MIVSTSLASATPAMASLYAWDISGSGNTGSGTFTLDDSTSHDNPYPCSTCANGGGYLVTAITGTINGDAITALLAPEAFAGNDNLFYPFTSLPGNVAVDLGGISFATAAKQFNLYAYNFGPILIESDNDVQSQVEFTARLVPSAVPEPAAWAMMLMGFGMVGGALRFRTRRQPRVRFAF
jgi:hypothetical protein